MAYERKKHFEEKKKVDRMSTGHGKTFVKTKGGEVWQGGRSRVGGVVHEGGWGSSLVNH